MCCVVFIFGSVVDLLWIVRLLQFYPYGPCSHKPNKHLISSTFYHLHSPIHTWSTHDMYFLCHTHIRIHTHTDSKSTPSKGRTLPPSCSSMQTPNTPLPLPCTAERKWKKKKIKDREITPAHSSPSAAKAQLKALFQHAGFWGFSLDASYGFSLMLLYLDLFCLSD